jgi:outer membrane murein-binding lipoprotein Lpp
MTSETNSGPEQGSDFKGGTNKYARLETDAEAARVQADAAKEFKSRAA